MSNDALALRNPLDTLTVGLAVAGGIAVIVGAILEKTGSPNTDDAQSNVAGYLVVGGSMAVCACLGGAIAARSNGIPAIGAVIGTVVGVLPGIIILFAALPPGTALM